jgi:hypothetical protein
MKSSDGFDIVRVGVVVILFPGIFAVLFIPFLVVAILFIVFAAMNWLASISTPAPTSSKIQLTLPVHTPTPSLPGPTSSVQITLSDEEVDERIQMARAKAARIAGQTNCGHESRKKIFERVFHSECEQRGLKVSKVIWKSGGAVT